MMIIQSLADDEKEVLKNLTKALRPFRALNDVMPTQYVQMFLAVALDEGRTVTDYSSVCDVDRAVGSRQLLDLSEIRKHNHAGYGLVEMKADVMDRRFSRTKLTPKGKALAGQIVRALRGQAMNWAA